MTIANPSIQIQTCSRCLLDTHDEPGLTFNQAGLCAYCERYDRHVGDVVRTGSVGTRELTVLVDTIRRAGEGKPYDCILGLSGGVDSTYLAWQARQLGLRPLLVHFDNGWNSELAVGNIEQVVNKLQVELFTHVIDWDEFRSLQLAFLRASVVDIELITDHAILASLYQLAVDKGIKYILSGSNYVTESILPTTWIHDKRDHVHIRAINDLFGTMPLRKFPLLDSRLKWKASWHGIESVSLLNYMPYVKQDVKELIQRELAWRDYGGKHYESVFTRFYQGYILPVKFGIDKRRAHLSNLICSGQITREEAVRELAMPAYPEEMKNRDRIFVLKKLGLSEGDFEAIMQLPVKRHQDYPVDQDIYSRYPVLKMLRPAWKLIKQWR